MTDSRPSLEELTWGQFGRCVACRKHPAIGPLGYCGTCHWEVVMEMTSGWLLFDEMLAAAAEGAER